MDTRQQSGFTLFEILAVVMIIGIIVAIGVMSVGLLGGDRELQRQALRLSTIVELSSEEAQMQGRDFGLEFMQKGYRFVEYDPILDIWAEVLGDDMLGTRQLEETMEFELIIEDREVLLQAEAQETETDEDDNDRDLTDDYLPHVLVMSSGDITPFEIRIYRDGDNIPSGVTVDAAGVIELLQVEDDQF